MVETNDPSGKRALRAALLAQLKAIGEQQARLQQDHSDPALERDLSQQVANIAHRLRKAD